MRNADGYTILELIIALAIAALVATLAAPPITGARNVLAVRAATAELAATLAATRAAAVEAGGASLLIDIDAGTAAIVSASGSSIGDVRHIALRHGVHLESSTSSPLTIRYDAIGVGRMAQATIGVRRGNVRGVVTVSSYGRVRT